MPRTFIPLALSLLLCQPSIGQEPLDIFSDAPPLSAGFVRIGTWNVRHIDLVPGADSFFAGNGREADLAILTATLAKAIRDMQLDLAVLVEVQPRAGEPDRLRQVVEHLNSGTSGPWRFTQTNIDYDNSTDPYGNLQFGVVWNSARGVSIDPSKTKLLDELRQPRNAAGTLTAKENRSPWLVPVDVQSDGGVKLSFDMIALHLKSGGGTPQSAEVDAITDFILKHQAVSPRRHLIVCGDWNIRPDQDIQGRGRSRLMKMTVPVAGGSLMRILTVGDIRPTLDEWEQLEMQIGGFQSSPGVAALLPFSHVDLREDGFDTLLDHIAVSRTLDELFDHPVQVTLSDGTRDVRNGIEIVPPRITQDKYSYLTDHLPVVLTLRVAAAGSADAAPGPLRIVAAEPNPLGEEELFEEVHLKNVGTQTVDLRGWTIRDASGNRWTIGAEDATVLPSGTLSRGRIVVIRRHGRNMTLTNSGDTICLFDQDGNLIDIKHYAEAPSGKLLRFE